jgi:penicillin-binding protein 2
VPYSYRRDLTFDDFAVFAEHDYNIPGVDIEVKPLRVYPFDALACHVLGYVKLPDIQKVAAEKREQFDHYVADDYGGAGIEKSMDELLQGRAGKRTLRRDEKGVIRGEIDYVPPTAGADVYLTIDAKIQYITEEAMRSIGRGAAVVMDPRNGDILAMVSVPSYNPNLFIPSVSPDDWNRYTADESSPMYNRAMTQHPPGSTFKIPIALAGCLSHTNRRNFYCGGGVQYGNKYMQCWIGAKGGRHGSLDLSEAIKRSCNCYFYQYGNETGIRNIIDITSKLGLGRKTGIPLEGEMPGLVPTPEWLKLRGLVWSDAYTAMTSIGQGFTEATPLQMASVACSVANGGKVFQPRLVRKAVEKDGKVVVPDEPVLKADLAKEGITAADIEQVKRGMWKVVNEEGGTAGRARSPNFAVAGKTGTAQTGNTREPTNAWFICFAPYEEPEIAMAIFIHNADSGGKCGAPIGGHIIKQIMAMKHGYVVEAKPLTEAKGNFSRIDLVNFDNLGLDQFVEGDDADASVALPEGFAPQVVRSDGPYPQNMPSLRAPADSRGVISRNKPPAARRYTPPRNSSSKGFGGLFKKKGR